MIQLSSKSTPLYSSAASDVYKRQILSIIVIVLYGKLTASKKEKARKSSLKTKDILNAWSIYLLILVLIILTSPLFPGLRHTLENNWITKISLPINASLSLIHISEPTRQAEISYAVFCLKKKTRRYHKQT